MLVERLILLYLHKQEERRTRKFNKLLMMKKWSDQRLRVEGLAQDVSGGCIELKDATTLRVNVGITFVINVEWRVNGRHAAFRCHMLARS
jgi:hypothetical protein